MSEIVQYQDSSIKAKQRVLWVDLYRVIAILCALAVHVGAWLTVLHGYFGGTGRILFFFFISALFMKRSDLKSTTKRLLAIGIPYMVWCVIYSYFAGSISGNYIDWSNFTRVRYMFGVQIHYFVMPLWFLRALIIYTALNMILSRLNFWLILTGLIFTVFVAIVTQFHINCGVDIYLTEAQRVIIWGFAVYTLGVMCRRFIGIAPLLAFCERYSKQLLIMIVFTVALSKLIGLQFPHCGRILYFMISIFTVPAFCILVSQYFPHLVKQINRLAPAMFFVFISQAFTVYFTNQIRSNIGAAGHDVCMILLTNLAPFFLLALGCLGYYLLNRMKIFSGWVLIKI